MGSPTVTNTYLDLREIERKPREERAGRNREKERETKKTGEKEREK